MENKMLELAESFDAILKSDICYEEQLETLLTEVRKRFGSQLEPRGVPKTSSNRCRCNTYGQRAYCSKCGGAIGGWSHSRTSEPNDGDFGRNF